MKRIKLVVAYDGTNYHGWQVQPREITIEGVLNEALTALTGGRNTGDRRKSNGCRSTCARKRCGI